MAVTEQFVLDTEQALPFDGEVASSNEPHRIAAGRTVEGLGDRRPPVDHHRLAVHVGDGQTADVETLDRVGGLRQTIDPAEHQ